MMDGLPTYEEPYSSAPWFYVEEDESPSGKLNKRNRPLDSLGNLTLVTRSFNSSVSNKGFEEKKTAFIEQSQLMLTRSIVAERDWSEDVILQRSQFLAAKAVEIWPIPIQQA